MLVFALEKSPDIPAEVPLALDKVPTEELRLGAGGCYLAGQGVRPAVRTSRGIPADRKAALRAAFDATMKDPEFLAEANRMKLDVNPVTGAALDKLLAELYATPKDVVAKAAKAIAN